MSKCPILTTACSIILGLASLSTPQAATYRVDAGGGGDFLQIQPAVRAAAPGDTVLVEPGIYAGEIKLGSGNGGLWILGLGDNPRAAVVGDSIGIGLWDVTDPVHLENLEFRGVSLFGGMRFQASRAIVRDCVIRDNVGPGNCHGVGGGATLTIGSDVRFENCQFEDNTGWESPGGLLVWDSRADITGCTFRGNQACYGGGLEFYHCGSGYSADFQPSICEYSLFVGNTVADAGGAITSIDSSPIIRFNTFVNNTSANGNALRLIQGEPVVESNVIVGSPNPISCASFQSIPPANPIFGTNLIWDHEANWTSFCADLGDILSADPLFCDARSDDYSVCSRSPCLGEAPLGAFGQGCVDCQVPVLNQSIGGVKRLYR